MHSIVFGGYSADSLAARILDAGARVLITADGVYRGTKLIKLLEIAHHAMDQVLLHILSQKKWLEIICPKMKI